MSFNIKAFKNELFFINLIFFNPIFFNPIFFNPIFLKYRTSEITKAVEQTRKACSDFFFHLLIARIFVKPGGFFFNDFREFRPAKANLAPFKGMLHERIGFFFIQAVFFYEFLEFLFSFLVDVILKIRMDFLVFVVFVNEIHDQIFFIP